MLDWKLVRCTLGYWRIDPSVKASFNPGESYRFPASNESNAEAKAISYFEQNERYQPGSSLYGVDGSRVLTKKINPLNKR